MKEIKQITSPPSGREEAGTSLRRSVPPRWLELFTIQFGLNTTAPGRATTAANSRLEPGSLKAERVIVFASPNTDHGGAKDQLDHGPFSSSLFVSRLQARTTEQRKINSTTVPLTH